MKSAEPSPAGKNAKLKYKMQPPKAPSRWNRQSETLIYDKIPFESKQAEQWLDNKEMRIQFWKPEDSASKYCKQFVLYEKYLKKLTDLGLVDTRVNRGVSGILSAGNAITTTFSTQKATIWAQNQKINKLQNKVDRLMQYRTYTESGMQTMRLADLDPVGRSDVDMLFTNDREWEKAFQLVEKMQRKQPSKAVSKLVDILAILNNIEIGENKESEMPEKNWDPETLKIKMRAHGEVVYKYTKSKIADALMRHRRNYGTQTDEQFIEPAFHKDMMEQLARSKVEWADLSSKLNDVIGMLDMETLAHQMVKNNLVDLLEKVDCSNEKIKSLSADKRDVVTSLQRERDKLVKQEKFLKEASDKMNALRYNSGVLDQDLEQTRKTLHDMDIKYYQKKHKNRQLKKKGDLLRDHLKDERERIKDLESQIEKLNNEQLNLNKTIAQQREINDIQKSELNDFEVLLNPDLASEISEKDSKEISNMRQVEREIYEQKIQRQNTLRNDPERTMKRQQMLNNLVIQQPAVAAEIGMPPEVAMEMLYNAQVAQMTAMASDPSSPVAVAAAAGQRPSVGSVPSRASFGQVAPSVSSGRWNTRGLGQFRPSMGSTGEIEADNEIVEVVPDPVQAAFADIIDDPEVPEEEQLVRLEKRLSTQISQDGDFSTDEAIVFENMTSAQKTFISKLVKKNEKGIVEKFSIQMREMQAKLTKALNFKMPQMPQFLKPAPPVPKENFGCQYNHRFPEAIYDDMGRMIKTGKMKFSKTYSPNKLQGDWYYVNSIFTASPWKPDGHNVAYEGVHMASANSRQRDDVKPIKYDSSPRPTTTHQRRRTADHNHTGSWGPHWTHLHRGQSLSRTPKRTVMKIKMATAMSVDYDDK